MKWMMWPLLMLLACLQYEIGFAPGGLMSIWHLHHQIAAETQIVQEWQARNERLAADIQDLKTGTSAFEAHARTDLGMIKPGEVFYQLP